MVTGVDALSVNSYSSHKSLSEKESAQGNCANNKVAYEGQEIIVNVRDILRHFLGEIRENQIWV